MATADIAQPEDSGNTISKRAYVYAISAGESAVKIGRAGDPQARLKDLQTSHYQRLILSYARECMPVEAIAVERNVHLALAEKKLSGEWFAISVDDAKSAIDGGFAGIRGNPARLASSRRETQETRLLRSMEPLTDDDIRVFDHLASRAVTEGKPMGYGLDLRVQKDSIEVLCINDEVLSSLARLNRFFLVWNGSEYSAAFNAITAYSIDQEGLSLSVVISGHVKEIFRRFGRPRLLSVVKAQSERIIGMKVKEQAA